MDEKILLLLLIGIQLNLELNCTPEVCNTLIESNFINWMINFNFNYNNPDLVNQLLNLYAKIFPILKDPEIIEDYYIFPNPSNGIFTFTFSDDESHSIVIQDVSGKVILDQIISTNQTFSYL